MPQRYILGPMQGGMFFQSMLRADDDPDSLGFDIEQLHLRLHGSALSFEALQAAWDFVAARHPILATSFSFGDEEYPQQIVHEHVRVPIALKDWSHLDRVAQSQCFEEFLRADREQGFDLQLAPAMRVAVILRDAASPEFVWTFHHIILDGRSFAKVLEEVWRAYEAFARGTQPALPAPPRPYRDYIDWLSGLDLARSQEFFKTQLAGKSAPTLLPGAEPAGRPLAERGYGEVSRPVSREIVDRVRALAQSTQTTVGTVVNAAWALVLGRFTGDDDVIFGSTRACRRSAMEGDAQQMLGLFINTLPLRARLGAKQSVVALLADLRQQVIALRDHEHTPLTEIQSVSDMPRGSALFDTLLMFENQQLGQMLRETGVERLADCEPELHEQPSLPLNVTVFGGEQFELRLLYDRRRFKQVVVERIAECLQFALDQLARDPERLLGQIDIVPDSERERIVFDWNATEHPFGDKLRIHEPFERQVALQPDAVAVQMGDAQLSYRQLDERANRLAHALISRGARPGVYVGICLTRGPDLVVALLAVAKSGAAYVPLDSTYPRDRLAFMLSDTAAVLVVTEKRHEALFDGSKLVIDGADGEVFDQMPQLRPPCGATPQDECYAIFTSGSTGVPKGVVLTHDAVINTFEWVSRTFEVGPGDRLLFVTSPCFDLSVYDTFGALGAGATVVVASDDQLADPQLLAATIQSEKITIWDSAPAALQRLVSFFPKESPDPTLRLVMLSGDWIPVSLPDEIRQSFSRVKVMSLGGATEAAIWSNWFPIGAVDPSWTSIPYGKPIQNARYHVLDANMRPVPIGVSGDLYIGGVCLAAGYLNRPELTAERFMADPFRDGQRLYKTGDLARYFDDGNLEFLGRADFQVKIRGFRVEIGEVEAVTASIGGVREAVCAAYTDASGQKSLVAYVVLLLGASVTAGEIKDGVAMKLPSFMVPSQVVFLDTMPISPNGKLDRKSLPSPTAGLDSKAHLAPRTELERELTAIWEELLGRSPIGVRDNFFELGGHSLLAVMLVTRAKRALGMEFPLAYVMEQPTIEALAERLDAPATSRGVMKHLVVVNPNGTRAPLFLVAGAGGHGFVFQQVAALLGADQPVYVLQAVGSRRESDLGDYSIEEMAEIYEREILPVKGDRPAMFAGYSFGALVAFELAHRSEARGEQVELFISLDGFAPRFPRLLPLAQRLGSHFRALRRAKGAERWDYLVRRIANVKLRGLKLLGQQPVVSPVPLVDEGINGHLNRLEDRLWAAQRRYDPNYALNSALLLVKCEEPERWVGSEMDDPLYGWDTCHNGPISILTVPGDHYRLFEDENPSLIAQAILKHGLG